MDSVLLITARPRWSRNSSPSACKTLSNLSILAVGLPDSIWLTKLMLVFDSRPSSVWLRSRRLRSVAMAFPSARSAFTALGASELMAFEAGGGAAPGGFFDFIRSYEFK